ncbi:hypothetical protein HBI56_016140 [Parastagonospora nodorum]|uniref:Uncharacterized protein n=2 Tax=Phaeosphaeria nodorum (strain SN15 / ATCC MYA-4574 / FGSC 10173) TaxID=321614 RepID=A0A7U2F593_PHANO|nr:hypothetical protein SNOG_01660 [Parastagonospora nodorum SN15]KAH3915052.1 hypothetical protein HBH56_083840 [Parastagonospora nodorum]EAT91309.1 hypothetical protein SNOG_01660 [Parastagonospora nodorum SN15]KAH3929700.1 hypothetical protein HBH54_117980 [Parastagonospora nodorum]KAH3955345.1 hypothetical protein HBH53_006570 [Parastagonospora nodorum]KAH3976683.1 hypothetical protein HBH51_074920 [Parastagonospora nodorum]
MAAPFVHPQRAALLADEPQAGSDATVSTRQYRINRELVDILQRPAKGPTSIQGIGLYTHAAAPRSSDSGNDQPSTPRFLPIGRSKAVPQDESGDGPLISEDVRRVWYELREAINEEEEHFGQADMSMEQLKERYAALDVPDGSMPIAQTTHAQQQKQLQYALEYMRLKKRAIAQSGDAAVAGTNADGASVAATSTNPAPRGNEYNGSRDPRRN